MAASSPVKIAVVGVGLIGPRHAEAIIKDPNAVLFCVVDPSPTAKQVAETLQTTVYPSIEAMLSSPTKPDGAIVCTPNHTHVQVSKQLLDAGIHVLCEKPISVDIASGQSLVDHAASLNLHLLTGHHRRFNRYITATKQLLTANTLGRLIAISGLWTLYKPASYFEPPTAWRRTSTGGPVLINLIHEIDILHYLFGRIERITAEATPPQRGHDAEEGAALVLRFASGVVGTFLLCDATPSPHSFEMGTGENPRLPRVGRDVYRVFGAEAALSVPDMRLWRYGPGVEKSWESALGEEVMPVEEGRAPFELQVEHFVKVIRGEEEPRCSGEEGLAAVRVCEAVRRALRMEGGGGTVEVDSVTEDSTL